MSKRFLIGVLGLILVLSSILLGGCGAQDVTLTAYVGDGMKDPMTALKENYEAEHPNVTIEYFFSGSGSLEQTIRSLKQGDLYMPGAKKYIDSLDQDGLVITSYPVALHVPSIIVRKGDDTVTQWDDLAADGVKICIPNPDLASSGKMADLIISKSPQEDQIRDNITILAADVRETVQFLLDGEVDAVMSWGTAVGLAPDQLQVVEIPEDLNEIQEIWFAVLTYTTAEDEARAFAEYVAGPEGQAAFREANFAVIEK